MLYFYKTSNLFNLLSGEHKKEIFDKIEKKLKDKSYYNQNSKEINNILKAIKQYDKKGQFTSYENFLKFETALNNFSGSPEKQKQKILQEITNNNIDISNDDIKNLIKTMIEENLSNTLLNDFDSWIKSDSKSMPASDSLTNFAFALKNISTNSTKKKSEGESDEIFLGPWIQKHYPKKLIPVEKKYNEKHKNNIYQIKVLKQLYDECGIHAYRNALYLVDMFSKPREEFNIIYKNMNNNKEYEAFVTTVGCKRNAGMSIKLFEPVIKMINESKVTCSPDCIPQDSKKYVKQIQSFTYYANVENNDNIDWKNFLEYIKIKIKTIEPTLSNISQIAYDVSSLMGNIQFPSLIDTIRTFCKDNNGLIVWDVGAFFFHEKLQSGPHAVAFAEHKHNNKIEYIYTDSGNTPLGESISLSTTIDRIISLTSNLDYFNDTLVRYFYYNLVYTLNETDHKYKDKALMNTYGELKKLNLLENKLYQSVYKNVFDKLVS